MSKDFFDYAPFTCHENPRCGNEPPLTHIIYHYYRSHDIDASMSNKLTKLYIEEIKKNYKIEEL